MNIQVGTIPRWLPPPDQCHFDGIHASTLKEAIDNMTVYRVSNKGPDCPKLDTPHFTGLVMCNKCWQAAQPCSTPPCPNVYILRQEWLAKTLHLAGCSCRLHLLFGQNRSCHQLVYKMYIIDWTPPPPGLAIPGACLPKTSGKLCKSEENVMGFMQCKQWRLSAQQACALVKRKALLNEPHSTQTFQPAILAIWQPF